jgi:hypothetical protein
MPTHKEEIMRRLRRGETLTRRDALLEFGCGRLAARINELRDAGEPIETEMVEVTNADGSTSRVAEYSLKEDQEQRFGKLPIGARFQTGDGMPWRKQTAFAAHCIAKGRHGGKTSTFQAGALVYPPETRE